MCHITSIKMPNVPFFRFLHCEEFLRPIQRGTESMLVGQNKTFDDITLFTIF